MGPEPRLPAARILSLVPSLTDAVFALGAGSSLIARTEWCVRPRGRIEAIETVGGTKNPDIDRISELNPDVILANREENTEAKITRLAERLPIWLTEPRSLDEVPILWEELGLITGGVEEGLRLADRLRSAIEQAQERRDRTSESGPRFLYYVWKDPWMVAGHDTYISSLLETAGFRNAAPRDRGRYPRLAADERAAADIAAHLFATEPYRFELPGDAEGTAEGAAALLVDGEALSWFPSLSEEGIAYARELLGTLRTTG